ncbi:putative NADP-dependent alcohol dehydrogenase C 2 [Mycena leptocephala]|nr:putative NADP-dependent alcohol dehydrogenase C 2 [Mycena leptocephala]
MSIEFTVFKGSANDGIVESKTLQDGPTGNQVLVKITHSGIWCQIGENVSQFKVGDIVGWGLTHKTCGKCEQCGKDQYCPNREFYGAANFHQGSFGSHAIWDASFLFKVPAGIAPEDAAPLMCGGATVFNVIESFNIRPTDRVGVVGIGSLGQLAIQFLAKIGASVVVFSGTDSKRAEAMRLGATEFYATKGVESFDIAKVDHLLVTTSFHPDWNLFISVLKPTGTIYPLSADTGEFRLPFFPIFTQGLTIQASMIAARSIHRRMLDFAARHQVKPITERFPMTKDGVEEGMAKLGEGKMRYRGVLVANAQ